MWVCLLGLMACGSDTRPKMDWEAEGYLSFPWPNDLRRLPDGSLDLKGFPGLWQPLLNHVVQKGQVLARGFGTNAGVMFQFTRPLNGASLPDARGSLVDDANIMLVNIDPESSAYMQRVPVRTHFDAVGTLHQPGHLLTLMPSPGYALEPSATYAAILFTGLEDLKGRAVTLAASVIALQQGRPVPGLDPERERTLQQQWQQVATYVQRQTLWQPDQIAAFTVYTTMDPTRWSRGVAAAVAAFPDAEVLQAVEFDLPELPCGYYNVLPLRATVHLPVWQAGPFPYLTQGMVQLDSATGMAIRQGSEATKMTVHIGCQRSEKPRLPMIHADGTGGSSYSAGKITGYAYDDFPFDQVALSVAPHQTGIRASALLSEVQQLLAEFGVEVSGTDLEGVAFYNFINPAANVGNHIQSAADQLFLRRIARLLPQMLQRQGIDQMALNFDFPSFSVHQERAILAGVSQGASIVPMALAMDPAFSGAYLHAAASHAYFQAVHRGTVRQLIPLGLPGFVESEVDYFHPLMQLLQTFHEPADGVNYAPLIRADHLLQSAGYNDGCVAREASAAMGFALARAGPMAPVAPFVDIPEFFDPDNLLNLPRSTLPLATNNLATGGLGLFLQLPGDHYSSLSSDTQLGFFLRATGSDPGAVIPKPATSLGRYGCDRRLEQGYNP